MTGQWCTSMHTLPNYDIGRACTVWLTGVEIRRTDSSLHTPYCLKKSPRMLHSPGIIWNCRLCNADFVFISHRLYHGFFDLVTNRCSAITVQYLHWYRLFFIAEKTQFLTVVTACSFPSPWVQPSAVGANDPRGTTSLLKAVVKNGSLPYWWSLQVTSLWVDTLRLYRDALAAWSCFRHAWNLIGSFHCFINEGRIAKLKLFWDCYKKPLRDS